ncbi:LamG-like jellyroll fold domain-containing protein [Agrococcus casei]|uniref:LamG-like jellyroll fold domain-containing protein n=1 Tax=Agrococcus casei TaxID=343512 RepID=UPI003F9E4F30
MAYETLALRTPRAFENPPSAAPRWADLEAGLYAHWSYSDLYGLPNDAEVSSWTDRVNGFKLVPIPGLDRPTIAAKSNSGRGSLAFNYDDTAETARGLYLPTGSGWYLGDDGTSATLAAVFFNRSIVYGSNVTSRLASANSSTNYYSLGNFNNDHPGMGVQVSGGNGAHYAPADGSMEDRWSVVVATITPNETRLYIDDLPVIVGGGSGGTSSAGFRVGVSNTGASPFTGYLREIRAYNTKALSAVEARALIAKLRYEHLRIGQ